MARLRFSTTKWIKKAYGTIDPDAIQDWHDDYNRNDENLLRGGSASEDSGKRRLRGHPNVDL